eukprot:COSAG02_NODE_1445_length_12580_cov_8.848089_3_plen_77_part_00
MPGFGRRDIGHKEIRALTPRLSTQPAAATVASVAGATVAARYATFGRATVSAWHSAFRDLEDVAAAGAVARTWWKV